MSGRGPEATSKNTHSFETQRLIVDLPEPGDRDTLFGLVGGADRREVCATLLWDGPDSATEVEEWIASTRTETFAEFGYHWVLRDKTGDIAGAAGLPMGAIGTRPRAEPGRADVGYWLGRLYWGRGIMSEALSKLIELGFTTLDYYKIEADVFTTNSRGLRLVEGAGMIREGVIRRAYRKYGEWVDAAVYGIFKEEWEERSVD